MAHIATPARHPNCFVDECGLRSAAEWAELHWRHGGTTPAIRELHDDMRGHFAEWACDIIRTTLLAAAKADCSYCRDAIPFVKNRTPISHQYGRHRPICKARGVWRLITAMDGDAKCTD